MTWPNNAGILGQDMPDRESRVDIGTGVWQINNAFPDLQQWDGAKPARPVWRWIGEQTLMRLLPLGYRKERKGHFHVNGGCY